MSAQLKEQVVLLEIQNLSFSPNNRKGELDVSELAISIKEQGLLQPILVRPFGAAGEYQVVCGERRTRAVMLNGDTLIPAIIRVLTNDEAAVANTVENLQREDLHFLEEAEKVLDLLAGLSTDSVASLLGKSRQWVVVRANLTKLTDEWKEEVLRTGTAEAIGNAINQWPIAHLEEIAKLGVEAQHKVFRYYQQRNHLPGMRDLMRIIGNLTSLLSTAPFPLDYIGLKPGPCTTCTTRSHANADLFGTAGQIEPEDRCLNLPCFKAKIEQWGKEKLKEARDAADVGQKVIGVKAMDDPNCFKADGVVYKVSKKKGAATMVVLNGAQAGQKVRVEVAKAKELRQTTDNGSNSSTLSYQLQYFYTPAVERARYQAIKDQGLAYLDSQDNGTTAGLFLPLIKMATTLQIYHALAGLANDLVEDGEISAEQLYEMLNIDMDQANAEAELKHPFPPEWEGKDGPNVVKCWYELPQNQKQVAGEDDEQE